MAGARRGEGEGRLGGVPAAVAMPPLPPPPSKPCLSEQARSNSVSMSLVRLQGRFRLLFAIGLLGIALVSLQFSGRCLTADAGPPPSSKAPHCLPHLPGCVPRDIRYIYFLHAPKVGLKNGQPAHSSCLKQNRSISGCSSSGGRTRGGSCRSRAFVGKASTGSVG